MFRKNKSEKLKFSVDFRKTEVYNMGIRLRKALKRR
jgi:hypothetical protein